MSMMITAGLGSIDDAEAYVKAGANELFVGYVPLMFLREFGRENPLNRREVLYYNVQIGSESELRILRDMAAELGFSVSITINALSYREEQYDAIVSLVKHLRDLGFRRFIVADWKLIQMLFEVTGIELEISGELGEWNEGVTEVVCGPNVKRIIFPRQTTISEMKEIIAKGPKGMEYEAFLLNEKCHFTGAYCNSRHCDEFCHLCKVPYTVENLSGDERNATHNAGQYDMIEDASSLGATGCGLCDLWAFREIGITHLKIVSRGNASDLTERDIRAVRRALEVLEASGDGEHFQRVMKKELFPEGCSGICYREKE